VLLSFASPSLLDSLSSRTQESTAVHILSLSLSYKLHSILTSRLLGDAGILGGTRGQKEVASLNVLFIALLAAELLLAIPSFFFLGTLSLSF
jgi:hypothetical protein